jgi:hypothetical protein
VVEGGGFWAAAARCVIAGINLVSRGERRMSVFGTTADAMAWLEGRAGVDEITAMLA